jgi:hypothetical protein
MNHNCLIMFIFNLCRGCCISHNWVKQCLFFVAWFTAARPHLFTLLIKKYVNNYFKLLYKRTTRNNIVPTICRSVKFFKRGGETTCRFLVLFSSKFFVWSHIHGDPENMKLTNHTDEKVIVIFSSFIIALSTKHFSRYVM